MILEKLFHGLDSLVDRILYFDHALFQHLKISLDQASHLLLALCNLLLLHGLGLLILLRDTVLNIRLTDLNSLFDLVDSTLPLTLIVIVNRFYQVEVVSGRHFLAQVDYEHVIVVNFGSLHDAKLFFAVHDSLVGVA